jgi:type VI secretion system protein ImpE
MNAKELFQAGKLADAIVALNGEVRDNPTDARRRTFLFELLCFAGDFARAEKQLDILGQDSQNAQMGALLYRAALHAERTRHELFQKKEYPTAALDGREPAPVAGVLNGRPFESLQDADPRVGARLELFVAGQYLWIPFEHLASIEVQAPKRLRDLLWTPALVRTGPSFKGQDLGEVFLPVLAPFSFQHPEDAVRLGRVTEWQDLEDGESAPVGQKMLLMDGEEVPLLELRYLEFRAAQTPPDSHAASQ